MKVLIILFVAVVVLSIMACCKVAGDCSRKEEKEDEKRKAVD